MAVTLNQWLTPGQGPFAVGYGHFQQESFHVVKDSSQLIEYQAGITTGEYVTFSTSETYDLGANFATSAFTAPGTGTFVFDVSVYFYGTNGACSGLWAVHNTTADTYSTSRAWTCPNLGYATSSQVGDTLAVTSGDVCQLIIMSDDDPTDPAQLQVHANTYWRGYYKV